MKWKSSDDEIAIRVLKKNEKQKKKNCFNDVKVILFAGKTHSMTGMLTIVSEMMTRIVIKVSNEISGKNNNKKKKCVESK